MTALYEQWQAARQQRQDEVLDRRDQVDADLERWQSDRLAHAVQLRQDLAQMVTDLPGRNSVLAERMGRATASQYPSNAAISAAICPKLAARNPGQANAPARPERG